MAKIAARCTHHAVGDSLGPIRETMNETPQQLRQLLAIVALIAAALAGGTPLAMRHPELVLTLALTLLLVDVAVFVVLHASAARRLWARLWSAGITILLLAAIAASFVAVLSPLFLIVSNLTMDQGASRVAVDEIREENGLVAAGDFDRDCYGDRRDTVLRLPLSRRPGEGV